MVTLANWRERLSEDMQLRDFRPRTREGSTRGQAVHRMGEVKKLAPSSINVAVYAVRFLCATTLQRERRVFELLRVKMPERLPVALSRYEVRRRRLHGEGRESNSVSSTRVGARRCPTR